MKQKLSNIEKIFPVDVFPDLKVWALDVAMRAYLGWLPRAWKLFVWECENLRCWTSLTPAITTVFQAHYHHSKYSPEDFLHKSLWCPAWLPVREWCWPLIDKISTSRHQCHSVTLSQCHSVTVAGHFKVTKLARQKKILNSALRGKKYFAKNNTCLS